MLMQKKKNHETQYPWRCRPSRSAYRRLHRPSKRSATRAPNYVARICQAASLLRRLLSQRMALRVKYLWAKGRVSHVKVAQILHELNYSLQSNRKTEEGADH